LTTYAQNVMHYSSTSTEVLYACCLLMYQSCHGTLPSLGFMKVREIRCLLFVSYQQKDVTGVLIELKRVNNVGASTIGYKFFFYTVSHKKEPTYFCV